MLEIMMVGLCTILSNVLFFIFLDNIPALCCASNSAVAACLEIILQAMLDKNTS